MNEYSGLNHHRTHLSDKWIIEEVMQTDLISASDK